MAQRPRAAPARTAIAWSGTSCRKGGSGSAPSQGRHARCRARPSPAMPYDGPIVDARAAAPDRATGPPAVVARRRADVCGASDRRRRPRQFPPGLRRLSRSCERRPADPQQQHVSRDAGRRRPARRPARSAGWLWRSAACAIALAAIRRRRRRGRRAGARSVGRARRDRASTASVDSFLSFAPTYVLFALTLGLAVACARGPGDRAAMRIAFDGTTLRPGRTGVGYYTEHLLHHLARTATDDELIVVSNRPIDTTAPLPPRVRVATPARRMPAAGLDADAGATRAARGRGRRRALHQRHAAADVAGADGRDDSRHEPARSIRATTRRGACCSTVRWSISRRAAPTRSSRRRRAPSATSCASTASTRIACTSCTRRRRRRSRASHDPRGARARARSATGSAERIILYVGTIEPRKNLPTLIEAFADAAASRRSAAISWCASDRTAGCRAASTSRSRALRRRATRSTSPATCRSTICRRSTASPRCSSTRRCTRASACRSSRRWRAACR